MTVSVVMPYWNRSAALKRSLDRYIELYADLDLELVIVDDGSPEPPRIPETSPWPINVLELPAKQEAKNPCTPINAGVCVALGDVIILTNPEIIHQTPIISHLVSALSVCGRNGYVASACWDARLNLWLCRSDTPDVPGRAKLPTGAGLHFCAAMYREFFLDVDGFDEAYRDGQAYEDNDFLWRLKTHRANFKILDYCVVEHGNAPRTVWPAGGLERNKRIFEGKWGA